MRSRMRPRRASPCSARSMYKAAFSGESFRFSSEERTTAIGVRSSCDRRPAMLSRYE